MSNLSKEEIIYIANLAKLKLTDSEVEKFQNEFNNILDYISLIQECDTKDIGDEHHLENFVGEVLQEDIPVTSLTQDQVLSNATNGRNKEGYIRTSKIISKED